MNQLSKDILMRALAELDVCLPGPVEFLVGGGGAMVVLYGETQATHDVDVVPLRSKLSFEEIKPFLIQVAEKLDLPKDWINPYFGAFTHVLPEDYRSRLREFFGGQKLRCLALGPEDLLVMKLMAGRQKDDRHIRRLIKDSGAHLAMVESWLEQLVAEDVRGAQDALDRFDEFREALDEG